MNTVEAYHRALQTMVSHAVGSDLNVGDIVDGLLNQLAAVMVGSTQTREELEVGLEAARNNLDEKVIEYVRRTGHPHSHRRAQPGSGD